MTQTDDEWVQHLTERLVFIANGDERWCGCRLCVQGRKAIANALHAAITRGRAASADLLDPTQGLHIDDDKPYGGRDGSETP